jgi:exopolysaccharide/PEP-CTERM locus tyrosine autokinase
MRTIEEAANRLDALRRSGVVMPWLVGDVAAGRPAEPRPPYMRPVGVDTDPPEDARRSVTLDLQRLQRLGLLVPGETRTPLAQVFRRIKRPLLKNAQSGAPADRLSLIMVTSAMPGEGKTHCAVNLALSIAAEIDTAVLLVDADVVNPDAMQRLGVDAGPGLLDVLAGDVPELADAVLRSNVPKLSLLPAGTPRDMAAEWLASASMQRLLERLAAVPHRVVIFDAPPLLGSTEAGALASRVGQVLLVVEASRTPSELVAQAFAAVEHGAHVMSVLNKGRLPVPPYYGCGARGTARSVP